MGNSETTKRPRKSEVKSFHDLLSNIGDPFIDILLSWENIVGADNTKNMIPLRIEEKTLVIAVPNNMVLSVAARCKNRIIMKINEIKKTQDIENIKFLLDVSLFSNNIKNKITWRKR